MTAASSGSSSHGDSCSPLPASQGCSKDFKTPASSPASRVLPTYASPTPASPTPVQNDWQAASSAHVASIAALFETHLSETEIIALADTLDKLPGVATADDACGAD